MVLASICTGLIVVNRCYYDARPPMTCPYCVHLLDSIGHPLPATEWVCASFTVPGQCVMQRSHA